MKKHKELSVREWVEKRMEQLEKRIAKRCAKLRIYATFQGDPRGCTCKFKTTPFETDKWGHPDCSNSRGADVWNW